MLTLNKSDELKFKPICQNSEETLIPSGKVLLPFSLQFCLHLIQQIFSQGKESMKGSKNHIKCFKPPFFSIPSKDERVPFMLRPGESDP